MALFCEIASTAAPVPLAGSVELKKARASAKAKGKKAKPSPLPAEFLLLDRARSLLRGRATVQKMEEVQRAMLLSRLQIQSKGVEREFDETFHVLELRKGVAFTKKHSWRAAYEAFQRGLGGLSPNKWPLLWREETSQQLAVLCTRDSKKKDEDCLALARRVVDGFPKNAPETKVLRELPLPEAGSAPEYGGERLTAAYPEKADRDEAVYQQLLEAFLKGRDADFQKGIQGFLSDFPKSAFRFRAKFLQAELLFRAGKVKDAAPIYESIIAETPLSYHSIVASERLGIDLRSRIRKEPIVVNAEPPPSETERTSAARAQLLLQARRFEDLSLELETFSRSKTYSNDFLMVLMRLAAVGNQHFFTFKLANELIQRKAPQMMTQEMLDLLFPEVYPNEVRLEAEQAGIDPLLLLSLIKQESGFRPTALSPSGAIGLMQLMPVTAIEVDEKARLHTLVEPLVNISVGVKYLRGLLGRYEGNIPFALAAYNAGPHRVARWRKEALPSWTLLDWIESIPFKETRDYVSSILRHRYWYQVQKGVPVTKITELKSLTPIPSVDKN